MQRTETVLPGRTDFSSDYDSGLRNPVITLPARTPNGSPGHSATCLARGLLAVRRRAVNRSVPPSERASGSWQVQSSARLRRRYRFRGRPHGRERPTPAYRLRFARRIPLARLKAKYRKVSRKRGRQSLTVDLPTARPIRFRSVQRDGRAFRLLKAGELPERFAGGVYTGAGRAFDTESMPAMKALRVEAERDLPQFVADGLNAALRRRRR